MPVYHRYAEDPTGVNPDNLVADEICDLNDRVIRVAVPRYAPFFTKSLVIFDNLTQRRLDVNVDYRVPVILQEASLRYGQEVGDAILIENRDVSSQIRLKYQTTGGDIQNNVANIAGMFEQYLNDNRMVDWVTGLFGKPSEYPPGPHPHYLSDIFCFEPLTFELERIAQAIGLGNAPAFDAMIRALRSGIVTEAEIDRGLPVSKYVTLERLMYATKKLNYNSMILKPMTASLYEGTDLWFDVTATNVPDQCTYYWTIDHETTTPVDFILNSGLVNLINGQGRFMLQLARNEDREYGETFRVSVRLGGIDGHAVITSRQMDVKRHGSLTGKLILDAIRNEFITNAPLVRITARTHAAHSGAQHAHDDY